MNLGLASNLWQKFVKGFYWSASEVASRALITKAFYKCVRVCIDGEIHREHNCVFILIVSVARRVAPILLEPVAHPYNHGRKILTG